MSKIKDLLQIKYINIKPSDAVSAYIQRKIVKHDAESKDITSVVCTISLESSKAGKTYCVTIETSMVHAGFIVREKGNDVYKVIDDLSDKFRTRLVKLIDKQNDVQSKYNDEYAQISGTIREDMSDYTTIINADINPSYTIIERKKYYDNSPIHVEEAIQMMEMVGRTCFLFKNITNGKYTVVYKVASQNGDYGYGLLEHRD